MLTIFSIPKAFDAQFGVIQRNAIASWTRLSPTPEVILFGDESGVAEAAADLGVRHIPVIARNEWNTPLLDDVFAQAQRAAGHDLLCYSNADIVLTSGLPEAVRIVARRWTRFLLSGQRTNLDVLPALTFEPDWENALASRARHEGELYTPYGMDYFVFPRGLLPVIPAFAVGRVGWDNWMIYAARSSGAAVVDATAAVLAVHQNHSYAHIAHAAEGKGKTWSWSGPEAIRNFELAGGWPFIFSLADANWMVRDGKLIPALGWNNIRRRMVGPLARIRSRIRPRSRLLALARMLGGMLRSSRSGRAP